MSSIARIIATSTGRHYIDVYKALKALDEGSFRYLQRAINYLLAAHKFTLINKAYELYTA